MTRWIAVSDVEPPKDRVIEVTNGFAWYHEDYYFPEITRGRPASHRAEYTSRSWRMSGRVILAIWLEKEFVAIDNKGAVPPFTHWCEFDNPFTGTVPERLGAKPPYGLSQEFPGDARRAQHLRKAKENDDLATAWSNNPHFQPDTRERDRRAIQNCRDAAEKDRQAAERAHDPEGTIP